MKPNDVMYAGAGLLWGVVTVVRGARASWQRRVMAAGVTVTVAFALYLFMCVSARAEEVAPAATKPDLQTKIEAMQAKLDHAARRANQPAAGSSSVIGLRGS